MEEKNRKTTTPSVTPSVEPSASSNGSQIGKGTEKDTEKNAGKDTGKDTGDDSLWVEERHEDFYASRYRIKKILFRKKSLYQEVEVVESVGYGKILLNDSIVMLTERDEFIYHEMISHVPLFTHPHPQKVLIIGGGDGGTAREVLKHPSVELCRMVEIDPVVVEACRKHLPQTASQLNHPKMDLHIQDGVEFLKKEKDHQYDIILIDSTDPIGPAIPLFGEPFYQNVHRCLKEDGLVVAQAESPFYFLEQQKKHLSVLKKQFPRVHLYNYTNISYPGGLWSFSFAAKKYHPLQNFQQNRYQRQHPSMELKYYNDQIHHAAFALPHYLNKELENLLSNPLKNDN